MRRSLAWQRVGALVLAIGLLCSPFSHPLAAQGDGNGSDDGAKVLRPVPVIVAKATEGQAVAQVETLGSGLALRSVGLYPAVAGEVDEMGFSAGQTVRAGQVLLRLEERKQRLAVDLAAARLDAARRLLRRYENIGESGAVAGSVLDQARSDFRQAEIALAQAQEALRDRSVRAPFSGVVGLPEVQRGDRVTPETLIATLDDRSQIRVAFSVPEAYLGRLRVGQALSVQNVAYPERNFEGQLARIDSRIDPETRQVRVEALVANEADLLRPGMSFDVDLRLAAGRHVAVPELALQWDREGSHLWVIRDQRAVRVPVRMVSRQQAQVLVDGALNPGEPVVVEGVQRLQPGRAVQIIGSDSPAARGKAKPR